MHFWYKKEKKKKKKDKLEAFQEQKNSLRTILWKKHLTIAYSPSIIFVKDDIILVILRKSFHVIQNFKLFWILKEKNINPLGP